jgi:hypothetical protein
VECSRLRLHETFEVNRRIQSKDALGDATELPPCWLFRAHAFRDARVTSKSPKVRFHSIRKIRQPLENSFPKERRKEPPSLSENSSQRTLTPTRNHRTCPQPNLVIPYLATHKQNLTSSLPKLPSSNPFPSSAKPLSNFVAHLQNAEAIRFLGFLFLSLREG